MIHPTAIIHPGAEIGEGCTIGPHCVINEGVTLGEGCELMNGVTVTGPTKIGARNKFFSYASIGQRTQDLKYAGEPTYLEIGDDNTFREFTTVNRGTAPGEKTVIGSHNLFLTGVHIAHDCVIGNHVIFSNYVGMAGHIVVEDHVIIGGHAAVHQFCRIGKHAMTGGLAKIVQDIPPYMIVDGNPAVMRGVNQIGLTRHGFTETDIRALKQAYKALFLRKGVFADAVESLAAEYAENPAVTHLCEFIRTTKRGITR